MSKVISFGMIGVAGRMGQAIIELSKNHETAEGTRLQLTGAIDQGDYSKIEIDGHLIPVSNRLEEGLKDVDIVIDFSSPAQTCLVSKYCAQNKIPLVVGTTGFSKNEKTQLLEAAKSIPLIVAPNMSIGVNLLFELTNMAAQILQSDYDIEVVEAHHHFKKDAPSGTAVRLKEVLLNALNRDESNVVYGRQGMTGARDPKEIGVHTLRGGDVVGDHTVHFFGDGERVELTHKASSRATFASGALKAAAFLVKQKPGEYTMRDVLGLNI